MRALRSRPVLALVAIGLTMVLAACLSAEQTRVHDALNNDRRAHGRTTLPTHGDLNAKAQAWAEKLARDGRLSHSNLAQGVPSCWRSLGENVGVNQSIEAVQRAYMASAGHRANVLDPRWDFVGVGAAQRGSSWYTVQVFMQGCR